MGSVTEDYMTSAEAARALGVRQDTISRAARDERLPAEKVAKTWLIPRSFVENMAKSYQGRRGRPRSKRKYTRRVQQ